MSKSKPAAHVVVHWPLTQEADPPFEYDAGQTLPILPQLLTSVRVLTVVHLPLERA